MSRALRVLSHRSAVPEPGAGEGSRQGKKCPDPRPQGSCQPTCARGQTQPGHTHTSTPRTRPCRAQQCHHHGSAPPHPAGKACLFPRGAALGAAFCWYPSFTPLGWGPPLFPSSEGHKKGEKSLTIGQHPVTALPLCPLSSHGEQSLLRMAESLDNCPAINLPLCLTRGIKMSLLFIYFLSFFSALTVGRGRNPQASTRALLEPRDFGDAPLPIARRALGPRPAASSPRPGSWDPGIKGGGNRAGYHQKNRNGLQVEARNSASPRSSELWVQPSIWGRKNNKNADPREALWYGEGMDCRRRPSVLYVSPALD